jgi:tRNA(His) guanylyltransferase
MIKELDERMKNYEKRYELSINLPVIIRLDGRAFHTFTRGMEKPFDNVFIDMMNTIGLKLCKEIQNCRLAFLQSDEISFLVYNNIESMTWFGNEIQKMCSISASLAAAIGTKYIFENIPNKIGSNISFDSRAFIIPPKDVVNYFLLRQQDWERNSIQMLARKYYSQKQMQNKNCEDMHDMLHEKGDNWNNLPTYLKRGRCIVKKEQNVTIDNDYFKGNIIRNNWVVDLDIPIFKDNRDYILNILEK